MSKLFGRWGTQHDQWWECKFFGEGVIDQGGGFRDSISDLSEELCPSNADDPLPLPFFIRSPNQVSKFSCYLLFIYLSLPLFSLSHFSSHARKNYV